MALVLCSMQVLDWIVSPGGGFALEDRHPSAEKLTVVDGGFKISNISGLYIQVTARIDLSGYEVTRGKLCSAYDLRLWPCIDAFLGLSWPP